MMKKTNFVKLFKKDSYLLNMNLNGNHINQNTFDYICRHKNDIQLKIDKKKQMSNKKNNCQQKKTFLDASEIFNPNMITKKEQLENMLERNIITNIDTNKKKTDLSNKISEPLGVFLMMNKETKKVESKTQTITGISNLHPRLIEILFNLKNCKEYNEFKNNEIPRDKLLEKVEYKYVIICYITGFENYNDAYKYFEFGKRDARGYISRYANLNVLYDFLSKKNRELKIYYPCDNLEERLKKIKRDAEAVLKKICISHNNSHKNNEL